MQSNVFFYLLFGVLDVIAMIAPTFKIYRFPFWEYFKHILMIAICLSFASFVTRYLMEVPQLDMPIQFLLYVIFYRYLIKIKLYYAVPLAAIGYLFYAVIQFTIIPISLYFGIVNPTDLTQTTGIGTYLIQLFSDAASYVISFLIYLFGLGFSHVIRPPHDVQIDVVDNYYKLHVTANIVGTLVICTTMYWLFNFHNSFIIVLPTSSAALAILIFLSYRKDFGRV